MLPRLIGISAAAEMLLTGDLFDANHALRVGFLHRVVASDEVVDAAVALAERISSSVAPLALQATKHLMWQAAQAPFEVALDMGHRDFAWLRSTADAREGSEAFLEKRKPTWKGR
jgi:enoyl-CoA hydratase/carnithine racemase